MNNLLINFKLGGIDHIKTLLHGALWDEPVYASISNAKSVPDSSTNGIMMTSEWQV